MYSKPKMSDSDGANSDYAAGARNGPGMTTQEVIDQFWASQIAAIGQEEIDMKNHQLPLARVKKVMKVDEEVRNKMVIRETFEWGIK